MVCLNRLVLAQRISNRIKHIHKHNHIIRIFLMMLIALIPVGHKKFFFQKKSFHATVWFIFFLNFFFLVQLYDVIFQVDEMA